MSKDNNKPARKKKSGKIGFFSFFTGAGFLDLGFEHAGFLSLMANEVNPDFAAVYKYSREHMKIAPPVFGLQMGDVCAYLDNKKKRIELHHDIEAA